MKNSSKVSKERGEGVKICIYQPSISPHLWSRHIKSFWFTACWPRTKFLGGNRGIFWSNIATCYKIGEMLNDLRMAQRAPVTPSLKCLWWFCPLFFRRHMHYFILSSRADGAVFQGLFYQTLAPWENQIESTCWSEWFLQGLASNSVKGNTSPWELTYLPVERIPLEDIERLKGLRALSYKRPKNDSNLEGRALQRTESYSLGSPQLHSLS